MENLEQSTPAPEVVNTEESQTKTENVQTSQEEPTLGSLIPEDYKEIKSLKSFANKPLKEGLADLVKSFSNAQSLIGKKVAELPVDELKQYLDFPERPASADEYLQHLDNVEADLAQSLKEKMHELGLNPAQAKKFAESVALERQKVAEESEAKLSAAAEASEKVLRERFGLKYKAAMDVAQQAALELGGKDLVKEVFDSPVKNAKLIDALYKAGKAIITPDVVQISGPQDFTPGEAKDEISKLKSDKEFMQAYLNNSHKKHAEAVQRLQELYRHANS